MIDSLTASLEQNRVTLRPAPDLDSQARFRSTPDGGSPEAVPAPGLKTENDGNNLALDRDARLLAENAMRFRVASNLTHSTTSQVQQPIQEGNSL